MSLHAQLSSEAQAKLQAQRRNSTISSFILAILSTAFIGVLLLLVTLTLPEETHRSGVTWIPRTESLEEPSPSKVALSNRRKPSSPSFNQSRVLISHNTSLTTISAPEFTSHSLSTDIGEEDSLLSEWGNGSGPDGSSLGLLHLNFQKRCDKADRLKRLHASGGSIECEEAVIKALRWLQNTQSPDGSWSNRYKVGMTGLSLLAFLGHCETASSEEFGDSVLTALTYLINVSMKQDHRLAHDLKDSHWPYEHAIAVYAMAEAYTLCVKGFKEHIPGLKNALLKSGQLMIQNQNKSGGWDYHYKTDGGRGGDTSITGWHLQALKAMEHTRLPFKGIPRTSRRALEYMKAHQNPSGAIAYNKKRLHDDGTTLAAVGALCFQMWNQPSHRVVRRACRLIDQKMTLKWNTAEADLYGHYYAVQAMINYGGDYWRRYNQLFKEQLLKNQDPETGMFNNVGGTEKLNAVAAHFKGHSSYANHYRTCLATLMLEAYYRYLPGTGQQSK